MTKLEQSIALIQKTEKLALKYQDFGFHVAFSGGKDSQVIYELCKMAGVKFKGFFNKTSVDPLELLSFIKKNYPEVEWIKPEQTMYQLILKKGFLPSRHIRYCCDFLKERRNTNRVVMTGIRKHESNNRKNRVEVEHSCVKGIDKILFHPILEWTDNNVWNFLTDKRIKVCELYKSQHRIGCIGCPMHPKSMRLDFIRYPNFKKAYINTVQKLIDKGQYSQFESAKDVIDWWSSGISVKKWLANKSQYKIDYD